MNKPYRVCYGCFTKLKRSRELSPPPLTPRAKNLLNMQKSTYISEKTPHSRIALSDSLVQHGEGKHSKRDLKPEVSNHNVFSVGGLQPSLSPLLRGSIAWPIISKNMIVKVFGSRVSSQTASPVSVARVAIGQVLLSVRCKDNHGAHAQEALRRAKFKFPGRQKIIVSRKWGFTKFNRADYTRLRQSKRIVPDGVNAKFLSNRGPLANRQPGSAFISATSD